MIVKLRYIALLIPIMGIAQTNRQAQELREKSLAAGVQNPTSIHNRLADCAAVNVPYLENFESVTVPGFGECSSTENAGTGNNWETAANPGYGFGTTKVMRYKWNTASAANAWFFTNGLNLTAGQTYTISYRYGSAGSTAFTEKLKVHVGNQPTAASMGAVPLIDHPLVNNNVTPLVDNLTFTPQTSGVYFVGFNCYSNPDQFYLFVDDISVSPNLATAKFDAPRLNFYPNPVSDVLHIDAIDPIDLVVFYDMTGRQMSNNAIVSGNAAIDVRWLPKGNYLAKVVSRGTTSTFKFMKN